MKILSGLVALILIGLAAGCGARTQATETTDVPPPPIKQMLPAGYETEKVFDANLTEGSVPDKVVTAVGPASGELDLRPATVQVISWDADKKAWTLIFDAQKTLVPDTYGDPRTSNGGPGADPDMPADPTPLLDPKADVGLETVDSVSMLSTKRDQLVISAVSNYGGSGVPQVLAVVDFDHAKPKVLYAWRGEHLQVELHGDRILARSSYWIRSDSHCCPSRDYYFLVGRSGDKITELEDQRAYLGVLVESLDPNFDGPYRVEEVAKGSPAEGLLHVDDRLLGVENGAGSHLDRELSSFSAGETVQIVVSRNGTRMTVPVKLGSLKDAVVMPVLEEDDIIEVL